MKKQLQLLTIIIWGLSACQAELVGPHQPVEPSRPTPSARSSASPAASGVPSQMPDPSVEPSRSPAGSLPGVPPGTAPQPSSSAEIDWPPDPPPTPKNPMDCEAWRRHYYHDAAGTFCHIYSGQVFDQNGQPVPHAIVEIYNEHEYEKVVAGTDGRYRTQQTKNPPNYLKASKPGYGSRFIRSRSADGLLSYRDRFLDFGGDGSKESHRPEAALDPRPEVIALTGKNTAPTSSSKFNLQPEYTLIFSKPVNKSDVENKLTYHGATPLFPNVAQPPLYPDSANFPYLTNSLLDYFNIYANQIPHESSVIFDANALNFEWNQTGDQVILRFKPGYQLPANKSENPGLGFAAYEYRTTLNFTQFGANDRSLRDLEGNVRTENHFYGIGEHLNCLGHCLNMSVNGKFLEVGNINHTYLYDDVPPRLVSIEAINTSLRLRFSEIMAVRTRAGLIAGGMIDRREQGLPGSETRAPAEYPGNLGNVTGHKTAANYQLRILSQGQEKLKATWKALGGSAHYDEADETYHSVRLRPPRNTTAQAVSGFYPAHSSAWTGAVAAGWGQGSSPSESWTLRWRGVNRLGQLGPVREINVPGHELRTLSEWAAQVQLALAASDNTSQWQVQGSADGKHLQLRFSSDNWIGWRLESLSSSSAAFPDEMLTPAKTWAANQDWAWWQPGDSLEIEVIQPILDPAGNPIADDGKKASLPSVP